MQTVKRFVCYYAGINLVLAALLLAVAWFSPDDAEPLAPNGISNVSLQDPQGASLPPVAKRT